MHWCPPARADSQSPATTVFDPSTAVRVQLGPCRSSLCSVLPQVNTDKHFPRHMVDMSLSAITYNACAVSISQLLPPLFYVLASKTC